MMARHPEVHRNEKPKRAMIAEDEEAAQQPADMEVMPMAPLTGGNLDVRITEGYNNNFVGHAITVPSANLQRNNTVLVANPTPPTNVPAKWQGTPGTPYLAVPSTATAPPNVSNNPSLLYERNGYAPASWATPAAVETPAGRGAFINGLDSIVAGGKPESSGAETSQSLTGTTSLTSGWPRPAGDGTTSVTVSAYNRGTGPETYNEFPNQNHPSTISPPYANNPTLTSTAPTTTTAGTGTILVTATGTNFTPAARLMVDGVILATTWVSATSITANVPKKAVATPAGGTVINLVQGDVIMGTSPSGLAFT